MNQAAQVQEFLNTFNIENTPPDKAQEVLAYIRNFYEQITDQSSLSFVLFRVADYIMRLKSINEDIRWLVEQCIYDIISKTLACEFRVGSDALRPIFDIASEYYKHQNLDPTLRYPLGMNHKLNWYDPEVGENVDVVKPYITSTGYCNWTRGVLLEKQNKKWVIQYANTESPVILRDLPLFDKLGTRTKDFDWRMNLNPGDQVDAFNRYWYSSTVTQVGVDNGIKRARISYRRFCQNGQKVDLQGQRYNGMGPNQDQWIDVLSGRIQKPGRMAKAYCSYSFTAEEYQMDDSYDLLFEKQYEQSPFWAIMRINSTRSLSYLHFFESFASRGAYTIFQQILQKKDYPIDAVINMMLIFAHTSWIVPRMSLKDHLPQCMRLVIQYLRENSKHFNNYRLDVFYQFVTHVGNRLYSLTQKHNVFNQLRKELAVEYLQLNLQKNLCAIRFLLELIRNPLRPFMTEEENKQLYAYFVDKQIFYKLIQNNVHEQVLSRSVDILKFLLDANLVTWKQIEHIWNVIPHSDLRGRATIQKLLADISKNFKLQHTQKLIELILSIKQTEITSDKLFLLRTLKDYDISLECKQKILNYLWQCITVKSTNIKPKIQEDIENVYRGFIATLKQYSLKLSVLKAMVSRLKAISNVRNQMVLFREFILTYPQKPDAAVMVQEGDFPTKISQVIDYIKTFNVYDEVVRLLGLVKSRQKIQSILEFLDFLFSYDSADISHIVQKAYDILGPTETFLIWAKHQTYRATTFFVEMYQQPRNMQRFEKISAVGIDAIKTILLDINVYRKNIRILKKKKTQVVVQGPVDAQGKGPLVSTGTGTTPSGDYSVMPPKEKQQILTFIYVLKSPFEVIGVEFLLQLLRYISSNSVYNEVIKLIITFLVKLDENIMDQYNSFLSEFLRRIMASIENIINENIYNDSIKLQLETYIHLMTELISETEKEGLSDMVPHFTTLEVDILKLKFQNEISQCQIYKKEPYWLEISDSQTLWRLKLRLAEVYKIPARQLDIIKYVAPFDDSSHGKALNDLFIFNEETLKVSRKPIKDIPHAQLLHDDKKSLSKRFENIVEKWYKQYQNQQGVIDLEGLKKLVAEKWKKYIWRTEDKIIKFIEQNDKDKKGGINFEEFKEYFVTTSQQQPGLVWKMINASGYLNNLRTKQDQGYLLSGEKAFPRKILSNQAVYIVIFRLLKNSTFQPLHLTFYRFLGMLETDTDLANELKSSIKQFLQAQQSIYRLSYGVETLLSGIQHSHQLYAQFYQHRGHIQIANKLSSLFQTQQSVYKFQPFIKTVVIPNLLKLLNVYIYPLLSQNPFIRFIKKIKINILDTCDIPKAVQNKQNYILDEQIDKRNILNRYKDHHLQMDKLYSLCLRILNNLIAHYDKELLVRLTNQIVKLYGYLTVVYPNFQIFDIFHGSNSESLNLRRSCHTIIYIYALHHPEQQLLLLEKMVSSMPEKMDSISNTYLNLIGILLEKVIEEEKDDQYEEFFKKLALRLVEDFLKRPNQSRGALIANKNISGILNILLILLQKRPKIGAVVSSYREQMIRRGLFAYGIKQKVANLKIEPQLLVSSIQPMHFDDYVKCKTEESRKLLMEVIYLMYKNSTEDHSLFFETFLLPLFDELGDTSRKITNKCMFVGLNNFGSTCYMNSMLQTLNSIDILRNAVLKARGDSALLRELQSLFSYLFFSQRIDYAPKQLLNAFVPPINPSLQQDTTQFLNLLFDRLEQVLKPTPFRNILTSLFQGNQVAQMICHNCGAKRERIEEFYTYSVEIEGKYDLHSALQGMHAGELISDCLCQSCNTRSDTTKRNVLNDVPNIFFVHLKRIVFNYDLFMNNKIHTRLYFPDDLNFEPYTKEGLQLREKLGVQYIKSLADNEEEKKKFQELALHGHPKEYYQLKLKGIIVHSGTPDAGHYYAILKKNDSWVRFDDSRVTTFSATNFEDECYGGNFTADEWGGSGSSKNAYVLIYEKATRKQIQIVDGDVQGESKVIPYAEFAKPYNQQQWYKTIWMDNHSLMLEQQMIGETYSKQFIAFVCNMLKLISSSSTIQLITQILFKVSALSGQVGDLPEIFSKNLDQITPEMFKKYVLSDNKRTFGMLFHHQAKVRQFVAFYIQRLLMKAYLQGNEEEQKEAIKFIQEYLQILHHDAAKNWLRIDGYFRFFDLLVQTSIHVPEAFPLYQFLKSTDIVAYFIDFALEKSSPLTYFQKKYSLGTKLNPMNFSAGLSIIYHFLRNSYHMTGLNYQVPPVDPKYLFHFSDSAIICLSTPLFYEKMIKENQNPEILSCIIERLCIKNIVFSESIARVLLKVINENVELSEELDTVLRCVSRYLRITDQFWIKRAQALLGTPSPFIYQSSILSSIDQEKYVYPSVLENIFPLESLLYYAYNNRVRIPLTILNMVKVILEGTSVSSEAMQYVLNLPPPCYYHERYIDWIRPFVNNVINHLNVNEKKKEEITSKISICNLYLDDLEKVKKEFKVLFMGEVVQKQLIETIKNPEGNFEVNFYVVPVYVVESRPNGSGNDTFEKHLSQGKLIKAVTPDSNILRFFKYSSKPLAIKSAPVEEEQQKFITGLFDENPYPSIPATAMQIQEERVKEELRKQEEKLKQAEKKREQEKLKQQQQAKMKEEDKKQQEPTMNEEIKQQEGKDTEKKQVFKEQVNINGVYLSKDYLHCIQFINKSDSSKFALLEMKKNENTNNTLPTALKYTITKGSESFYYTKFNPDKPWGQYQKYLSVFNVIDNPKPYIRLYPNPWSQMPVEGTSCKEDTLMKEEKAQEVQEVKENIPEEDPFAVADEGMISCPICTYYNASTNQDCEICGSPLH